MHRNPLHLLRAAPLAALAAAAALFAPSALSQAGPAYQDAAGDGGAAPDILGVSVVSDKASGQVLFRISGTNLATSPDQSVGLAIDSDVNAATGDVTMQGADYLFEVDPTSYGFWHWDGSDWVDTPYETVRVTGGGSSLLISVNRSEIGNAPDFNFAASSWDAATNAGDSAPDDGMFNYSLDRSGPLILGALVQTTPVVGPKAGARFVVTPSGIQLPATGAAALVTPAPETYSCLGTLRGSRIAGRGVGGCTFLLPKASRGKTLKVVVTVAYQGATASFTYGFPVR